jgi:hypothetical protein
MDQVRDNKDKSNWLEKPKTEEELIEDIIEQRKAEEANEPPAPPEPVTEPEKVTEAEPETEAQIDKKPPETLPNRVAKYAVIGFIIGALLMCLWYAVSYMMNDLLVSFRDLERKGITLKDLGTVSAQQGVSMAAASIRNFAGERKKLFVTGMAQKEVFDRLCDDLKKELSDYELVCARDVLTDPDARVLLLDCDAVVLLEQKGVTKYSAIREEATFLYHTGKEIIGVMISGEN